MSLHMNGTSRAPIEPSLQSKVYHSMVDVKWIAMQTRRLMSGTVRSSSTQIGAVMSHYSPTSILLWRMYPSYQQEPDSHRQMVATIYLYSTKHYTSKIWATHSSTQISVVTMEHRYRIIRTILELWCCAHSPMWMRSKTIRRTLECFVEYKYIVAPIRRCESGSCRYDGYILHRSILVGEWCNITAPVWYGLSCTDAP